MKANVVAIVMIPRFLVVVMVTGACGEVASNPVDAAATEIPVTYKGTLAQTPPKMFGGSPYCTYTITFKQLDVELSILPSSKQVTTGHVQDLNIEAVVPTTPACPFDPASPTISNFTFASATPSSNGMTLMFQGAATNTPAASLTVGLSSASSGYTAALSFHRTDQSPPLDWSVQATIPVTPQ